MQDTYKYPSCDEHVYFIDIHERQEEYPYTQEEHHREMLRYEMNRYIESNSH